MQTQKVQGVATCIYARDGWMCVRYHDTEVVRFNADQIMLNSDGWKTNTTKVRMNQTSNQFRLGYQVYQKDFEWYVVYRGETLLYHDDMTLERGDCGTSNPDRTDDPV